MATMANFTEEHFLAYFLSKEDYILSKFQFLLYTHLLKRCFRQNVWFKIWKTLSQPGPCLELCSGEGSLKTECLSKV